MTYFDILIRNEYKFFRSIIEKEKLETSTILSFLQPQNDVYKRLIQIAMLLEDRGRYRDNDFDEILDEVLSDFRKNDCAEFDEF